MDQWIVGGTLMLIGVAYVAWDIRSSLNRGAHSSDGGGDGSDNDSSGDSDGGGGGDGD